MKTNSNMEKAKAKKDSKYAKVCKLIGVWSLTELRFVTKESLMRLKGVGRATAKYVEGWLADAGFAYGRYSLQDYLKDRNAIWEKAAGVMVFKYKVRPIVVGLGVTKEWAIGYFKPEKSSFTDAGKPKITFRGLTSQEAWGEIEERGLVLAHENADGDIYDSPDGAFLKQFGHGSADLSGANYIYRKEKEEEE